LILIGTVGIFLGEMCEIKELPRYPNLSKLALACVVLSNSNADSKPIFTMLKKIQTEHRSELANDTICSLVCANQNQNMECYEYCHNVQNEDSLPSELGRKN
jgi:hypothetical protein